MSRCIEVMVIVEGKTEEIFIKKLVSPYLARNNIFMHATQISKPGQKGGDVKFVRAKEDFGNHLKQRPNTYVTLFVDYYGIKSDWPGLNDVRKGATPNGATILALPKKKWRPHCDNRKIIAQTLYTIGDRLAEQLRSEGYEAVNVDLNNNYRPEKDAADVTEMTEFHPEFSHRYAALAAGIGRLGWSGNLLTKEYGSLVELGSVLTSASLTPDTPIPDEEHPCDGCKMCSLVCPVEMIHPKESTKVTVAGITETISRKRPNTCCWIGCTGYEGLSTSIHD